MPNSMLCPDCISLVGASRLQEPHLELVPLVKKTDPTDTFQCSECDSRWVVGPLGWSKHVD